MSVDVSTVSGRYAHALFGLAEDKHQINDVEQDLRTIKSLIDGSEALAAMVRSPLYKAEQVVNALSDILGKAAIGSIASNFVLLVARNRRLFALVSMIDAYQQIASSARGERVAYVTSARPLDAAEQSKLIKTLQDKVGGKIVLSMSVSADLLGGVVVKLGSRMVDASLKRRLERLRTAMKEVD